jgi:hypothetical protein
VVVDHALDVAGDPAVVAPVQALERAVVARTDARDELVVGVSSASRVAGTAGAIKVHSPKCAAHPSGTARVLSEL